MKKFKSFIALDLKSNTQNISIVKQLYRHVYGFKVGYRAFYNNRSDGLISEIKKSKCKLFLDLKLHDIPNTVSSAIDSLSNINPDFLTLHISGGNEMMKAVLNSIKKNKLKTKILGVTLLTSLDGKDSGKIYKERNTKKTADARESYNPKGLVPKRVSFLKERFPQLTIITDVALDPYTVSGHDGIINSCGEVLNDETLEILKRQALCHSEAGADIVAPSDMMDGRIGAIRSFLDQNNRQHTKILSYAAKYASCFYSPFRQAVGSIKNPEQKIDKKTYQMDPHNCKEAVSEVLFDLEEGADMVLIKPGGFYLDIVREVRRSVRAPILAYQVSGEYAMIKAAAEKGWIDEKQAVLESLICMKRAGCNGILSYFALSAAKWLKETSTHELY